MKYLQLFDHLGNLVKEFDVYVEGKDFEWAAIKPEPVWLGTIRLSNVKAALPVEPTPEPETQEAIKKEIRLKEQTQAFVEAEAEELKPKAEEEAEVSTQAPFTTPSTTTEEQPSKMVGVEPPGPSEDESTVEYASQQEVKHEPEKRSNKSGRVKRTSSQSGPKRSKTVPKRAS